MRNNVQTTKKKCQFQLVPQYKWNSKMIYILNIPKWNGQHGVVFHFGFNIQYCENHIGVPLILWDQLLLSLNKKKFIEILELFEQEKTNFKTKKRDFITGSDRNNVFTSHENIDYQSLRKQYEPPYILVDTMNSNLFYSAIIFYLKYD